MVLVAMSKPKEPKLFDEEVKRVWRRKIAEEYGRLSGNLSIPDDRYFFTLGGVCWKNNTIEGELATLTQQGFNDKPFLHLSQYASTDWKRSVFLPNSNGLPECSWGWGRIDRLVSRWLNRGMKPAVVNYDSMHAAKTITPLLSRIGSALVERDVRKCLVVVNVMVGWLTPSGGLSHRYEEHFTDPIDYIKRQARRDKNLRRFLEASSRQYAMKPFGDVPNNGDTYHSGRSRFRTLMFWLP
jgi:hypothetical protein